MLPTANSHPAMTFRSARSTTVSVCLAFFGGSSQACDFPLSTSKYSVSDEPVVVDSRDVEQLVGAFTDQGVCTAALHANCAANLEQCALSPECLELATCVRSEADPAAETKCVDRLGVGLEAHWRYENLRACWAEQYAACSVGNDFDCVGQYPIPTAERSELVLSQTLRIFGQLTRRIDLSVKVCGFLTDCRAPLAQTTTDPTSGRYTVTIPLNVEPGLPGIAWEGYRLVEGDDFHRMHIETNIPVWGTRVDTVQVFDRQQLEGLAALHGAKSLDAILVQVLDCQSGPAANIELFSTTGRVQYVGDQLAAGREVTDGRGACAVHDLEVGVRQEIVARRVTDDDPLGQVVARWEGSLPPGTVMHLKLYPRWR
jgi:hypothetical protein